MDDEPKNVRPLIDLARMTRKGPLKVWAGVGGGRTCAYCGKPIKPEHVEYELDFGDGEAICLMHAECFHRWREQGTDA